MNTLGMGGPVGQQQMMNAGTPGASPPSSTMDNKKRLNTYIYDYFLRNGMFDLARQLLAKEDIELQEKPSPNRKDVNGVTDGDNDSKDDIPNKPADLPKANVPGEVNSAFLLDWWAMFWDVWISGRSRGQSSTRSYLQHVQNRNTNDRQRMMVNPQMQNNMARNMMQNGVPENMRKMMMQGNRPQNPQQLQQMQRMMAQQSQMQREGSGMEMNGQQRPQTPGSGDNAPSPKRQRLDGAGFNGQMPPMGRGQNPGMPNQAMNQMQMQNPNGKPMQGMPNPNGLPQGSPALDGNAEFFANNARGLQQGAGPNANSNHALQDYQMQLMLLEQQNKKRLLMARQEQDATVANGPGGPMPGQQGFGGQAMSPSNSRAGPSPNPDKMDRGTPKMPPGGIPPQGLDAMQGRGSPAPGGFDPNMNPNMPPQFQMKMPNMIGPNGQMMPAATSHPAFNGGQMNGMTPQQMMEMRAQAQQGRPGGPWPGGPPPGMMQGQQPPPNMNTPLQRQMPPPPAPATGDGNNRTQPSSPSQSNAAPPTPSQTNKAPPKKKGGESKGKNKNKKNATTDATPASEAGDQPPTPTPAPPITPTAPGQPFQKNQPGQQPQPGQQNVGANQGQPDLTGGPFGGSLDGNDLSFGGMDFGNLDGQDVLENFDFDSFLNNNDEGGAFSFDANMNFGDGGLEAGGDV